MLLRPCKATVREKSRLRCETRDPREFDFLCRAYGLTRREREVTGAVLAGLNTRAITERLFISRHTVQDHLKSVFGKTGVRSRRELLATFGVSQDTRATR